MHSQIRELREMGGEDMMLTVQAGKVVKHFAYHPKECGLFNDVVSEVFKEGVEWSDLWYGNLLGGGRVEGGVEAVRLAWEITQEAGPVTQARNVKNPS